jgi:rod shape-determining protein MreD
LVLVASVLLGFQTTLFNDMRPFGVMTQVMVLFAACAGVIYGAEIGAVAGLIIGLMYDCVLTTPLGLASLVLGATAFVAGAFPYFVRDSSWWNKAIAVAIASAVGEILFPIAQALVGLGGCNGESLLWQRSWRSSTWFLLHCSCQLSVGRLKKLWLGSDATK